MSTKKKLTPLATFCRAVRARSYEHEEAIRVLQAAGVTSQVISILRQELDSLIRIMYLLSLKDMAYREQLVKDAVEGRQWMSKGGKKRITDAEMVKFANKLHGWANSVYKFGCAFVHLSKLHDYNDRDPMDELPAAEKADLLHHIRSVHGGPAGANPKMNDIIPLLPLVFRKLRDNLHHYLASLEAGGTL